MFGFFCDSAFRSLLVLSVSSINLIPVTLSATEPTVEVLVGPEQPNPGSNLDSLLNSPFAVCFEPDGAMWIVEYDGGRLMQLTADGDLVHIAGDGQLGYADGSAKFACFNKLHNIVRLKDGRLLMSDHQNHAVRLYDPKTELVSTYAGSGASGFAGDGGPAQAARFHEPICVELTADQRRLLVADIRNNRIRQIDLETDTITTLAGTGQKGRPEEGMLAADQPLFDPRAAISDNADGYYILDRSGHQLFGIDAEGRIHVLAGNGKPGLVDGVGSNAQLNGPKHMCLGPENQVFIADDNNNSVRKYDPTSRELTTVNLGDYRLKRPHGVAVRDGWLYIADSYHHRVLRVKLSE